MIMINKLVMSGIIVTAVLVGISFLYLTSNTNVVYGQFYTDLDENDFVDSNSTNTDLDEQLDSDNPYLVLTSQKLKKASYGYRDLVGQVKNIGNSTAEFVKITLNTYDKNGDLIGTDMTYANPNTLKAGQKSSFTISSSTDNFKGMKYYELSLQWDNPDGSEEYIENAQIYKDKK